MNLTPEMIIGLTGVFGIAFMAILMTLKKCGIIQFQFGNSKAAIIGNNKTMMKCPEHNGFCEAFKKLDASFKEVRDDHIVQGEIIKQHGIMIEECREMSKEIRTDVAAINTNIAVLLAKTEERRRND